MVLKSVSVWKNESALLYTRETFTPPFRIHSIIHVYYIIIINIMYYNIIMFSVGTYLGILTLYTYLKAGLRRLCS